MTPSSLGSAGHDDVGLPVQQREALELSHLITVDDDGDNERYSVVQLEPYLQQLAMTIL